MNRIEPIPWRGINALTKLVLIALPILAAMTLALTLMDESFLRRLTRVSGTRPFVAWLVNGNNAWFVIAGCLLLLALLIFAIRHRLVKDKRIWFGTGCPNCKERELVRIKRHVLDRFYGLIGVPAYRYACRNCVWRGLRVARIERTPEREKELEEAMIRFSPDGLEAHIPIPPYEREEFDGHDQNSFDPASDIQDDVVSQNWMIHQNPTAQDEDETQVFTHRYTVIGPLGHSTPKRRSKSKT